MFAFWEGTGLGEARPRLSGEPQPRRPLLSSPLEQSRVLLWAVPFSGSQLTERVSGACLGSLDSEPQARATPRPSLRV